MNVFRVVLSTLLVTFFAFPFSKDLLTMNEELKKARKAFDAESYGEMV